MPPEIDEHVYQGRNMLHYKDRKPRIHIVTLDPVLATDAYERLRCYPGLESDPAHAVAERYLTKGFGSMVVFGIKGGAAKGQKFIESLVHCKIKKNIKLVIFIIYIY